MAHVYWIFPLDMVIFHGYVNVYQRLLTLKMPAGHKSRMVEAVDDVICPEFSAFQLFFSNVDLVWGCRYDLWQGGPVY